MHAQSNFCLDLQHTPEKCLLLFRALAKFSDLAEPILILKELMVCLLMVVAQVSVAVLPCATFFGDPSLEMRLFLENSWHLHIPFFIFFVLHLWDVLGIVRCFLFCQFPSKRCFGQIPLTKSLLNIDLFVFLAIFYYFTSPILVYSIIPICTCKDTGYMHLCCHCMSPLPVLEATIPAAFMAEKNLGYPFCLVLCQAMLL